MSATLLAADYSRSISMSDFTLDLKVIIAIAAIIISIITAAMIAYLANWWRNKKALSYEVIAVVPLLTMQEQLLGDKIQIIYEGNSVSDVLFVFLKFVNSGNQPIDVKDFNQQPLDIVFDDEAQILSAEIIEMSLAC